MKHMKHMIGCFVMIAAAGIVFLTLGGDTPSWLPLLLLLCCPLMMIGMMVMMNHDNRDTSDKSERDEIRPVDHR